MEKNIAGEALARGQRPKFLEEVKRACRSRHFSDRTFEAYAGWVRRYVALHGRRHPRGLDGAAITAFLTHLATEANVSVRTTGRVRAPALSVC